MANTQNIGNKVKSLRESKNLSIENVAERAGLSVQQIESVEANEMSPSLSPLIKISRALGVRLGTFLDDQTQLGPVVTRKTETAAKNSIRFTEASHRNMEYFALSQDKASRHMEPFMIDLQADSDSTSELSSHEGEEFIYVLDGKIEINYGKETYQLVEGDSIYYDSIVPHNVHAADGKAKILGVIYAPF